MQPRKSIWPMVFVGSALETATFMSWLCKADPKVTTGLLAITLVYDLIAIPPTYSFFYKTYKESKDFQDFIIKTDMPIVSDLINEDISRRSSLKLL